MLLRMVVVMLTNRQLLLCKIDPHLTVIQKVIHAQFLHFNDNNSLLIFSCFAIYPQLVLLVVLNITLYNGIIHLSHEGKKIYNS